MNRLILILCLILAMTFVACGNEAANPEPAANVEEAASTEETTTEETNAEETTTEETTEAETEEVMPESKSHTFMLGEEEKTIEVPYEPKTIVVIGYDLIDIVDALGHKDKIIGVPDPTNPMFPSFLEGYENITSVGSLFGDDLEAIAGLKPDLILAGARAFGAFEDLSEIAPTVYFTIPGMSAHTFEEKLHSNIHEVAYLLNDEAGAEQAVAELKAKVEALNTTIGALEDPSAMFLIVSGKSVNVYSDNPESRYGFVYNEFGLTSVAGVEEIADEDKKVNNGEASRHGNSVSFEFIAAKDPNHILVIDRSATVGQEDVLASDTLNNPLVQGTKAGENDNIIYLNGTAWYLATGGIEATSMMLDSLIEALGK